MRTQRHAWKKNVTSLPDDLYMTPDLITHFGGEYIQPNENIPPNVVGLVVDALVRNKYIGFSAFHRSSYSATIRDLSDESITFAVAMINNSTGVKTKRPDERTCENIRTMVQRTFDYFKGRSLVVGKFVNNVFYKGEYDFIVGGILIDLKTTRYEPYYYSQVIYYSLLIPHDGPVGIYNARHDKLYVVDRIPEDLKNIAERRLTCLQYD